jgi:hypothetical protein
MGDQDDIDDRDDYAMSLGPESEDWDEDDCWEEDEEPLTPEETLHEGVEWTVVEAERRPEKFPDLTPSEVDAWLSELVPHRLFEGHVADVPWGERRIQVSVKNREFVVCLDGEPMPVWSRSLNEMILTLDPRFFYRAPIEGAATLWEETVERGDED